MRRTRVLLACLLAGVVVVGLGCSDTTSVPPIETAPQPSLIGDLLRPTGLLSCRPLPTASTVQTVGPGGGTINVGPHSLRIPAGALAEPVTITATAPSGTVNRVEFQPAGLEFERSAALTMSYANCNLLGVLLPKRIAYVNDQLNILYFLLSLDNLLAKKVTGKLDHFSGYAVAW